MSKVYLCVVWDRNAAEHPFDSQLIGFRHVSSLAHDDATKRMKRDNRGLSVDGESSGFVMHDAVQVILDAEMRDAVSSVQSKVVFSAGWDVLPNDSHELIVIVRKLHVMEADCCRKKIKGIFRSRLILAVNELVDNGEKSEATASGHIWCQSEQLPSTNTADAR